MSAERYIIKKLYENTQGTPDAMYNEYLKKHRDGVSEVYHSVMEPILLEQGVSPSLLHTIEQLIIDHDASKYGEHEFNAYRDHFYDPENNPKSNNVKYDHAWNHHQKSNPHHWQYWCLINDVDEPQVQPLDMPFEYIIEMLCDWQSAGKFYGNSALDWYNKQKNKMILSEHTRDIVEKYIEYLK